MAATSTRKVSEIEETELTPLKIYLDRYLTQKELLLAADARKAMAELLRGNSTEGIRELADQIADAGAAAKVALVQDLKEELESRGILLTEPTGKAKGTRKSGGERLTEDKVLLGIKTLTKPFASAEAKAFFPTYEGNFSTKLGKLKTAGFLSSTGKLKATMWSITEKGKAKIAELAKA